MDESFQVARLGTTHRLRRQLRGGAVVMATWLLLFLSFSTDSVAQVSVLTQHNDISRTGANTNETLLTTSNVNFNQFGKRFALPVDGQVYAQPLYVPNITINGATHNVLIVATENDSVYAFDADSNTGANASPLWKASLVDAAHGAGPGETPLNTATTINCDNVQPEIGITSTPVIDLTTDTIYVEAKSTNGSSYFHRLHALDLLTGNEKSPGPVVITATVPGTGDGSSNGQLTFDSLHQMNRDGLLLENGTLFLGFASHCDYAPYHGWLFSYDEATLTQKSVYVTTPNGGLGGFWMGGGGIAADASGNIYIPSGNGDFDTTNVPPKETGDTLLKFGTTNQILSLLDYFTPQDQANLNNGDEDLGSGGVLLLPDEPGPYPHLLVQAGKEGRIYVVNRDQMTTNNSHYCSGCSSDPEIVEESSSGAIGGVWGLPAYWNNHIYYWGINEGGEGPLTSIPINNGLPDFTNMATSSVILQWPGPTPSISSNGTTPGTAILWAVDSSQYGSPGPGPGPAVVYAFDATNISNELWNSSQAPNNRDQAGDAVKFSTPTIADGRVYVGTSSEVDVYGLLPPTITTQPASETVTAGQTATFTVVASGTAPLNYQWQKNGANISGATSASYTTPATTTADSGSTFDVVVSNTAGSVTSSTATLTVNSSTGTTAVNYTSGFTSTTGLQLNGSATWNQSASRLRLTDGGGSEAGSAFFTTPVNVQSFTNEFSFQLTNANADGFTFTIQNAGVSALGPVGGGLGYGPGYPGGTPGIGSSVAVKFDLYSNAGEGDDSTGEYTDGASPTVPAVDMTSSGVDLHSGDVMNVQMSYDGTTLGMTITDATTKQSFTTSWAVNIPAVVGGNTAYVGFTGGTGGLTATQEILSWTFSN
jgi:hypothetical protein